MRVSLVEVVVVAFKEAGALLIRFVTASGTGRSLQCWTRIQVCATAVLEQLVGQRGSGSICYIDWDVILQHFRTFSSYLLKSSYEQTPPRGSQSNLFDSFQSLKPKSSQRKVSPAMSSLQGYYGLKPKDQKNTSEGFEMAVYRNGYSHHLEGGPYLKPSPASHPPLSLHRKTRSLVNGLLDESNGLVDKLFLEAKEVEPEKLVRRRLKSETDFTSIHSDLLIREENSGAAFSKITGKCLALRPKAGNRTITNVEAGGLTSAQGPGDLADGFFMVRKSSSTPSLNDQDSISCSIRPTSKWSLKPDLQALSAATNTRPIFDGLPKPITGRKNKTALD